jgi:hypothetical protein
MIKFEKPEALDKKIRRFDLADLTKTTWSLVLEAIRVGRTDEALELIEYGCAEAQFMHDAPVEYVDCALTALARFDEEEIYKLLMARYYDIVKITLEGSTCIEDELQKLTMYHRGHFSEFTVVEEPDRYVVRYDPCGTGGRLKRH